MNINKVIKKQQKNLRVFLLLMCFVFAVFPFILVVCRINNYILYAYLAIIEILIIFTILRKLDEELLIYKKYNNKLIIKNGIYSKRYVIIPEKVAFVHVEKAKADMEIVVISKHKGRNKSLQEINYVVLKNHPYVAQYYYNIKKQNPEEKYFYAIVTSGGYRKYRVLDLLYSSCFNAFYSEETIKNIKEYRN